MKTINLEDFKVKIKEEDELVYTDVETIQKAALGGMEFNSEGGVDRIISEKFVDAKRVVAEVIIEEIEDNNGEKVEFTQEWISNLKAQDGMKLMEEIDKETRGVVKKKMKGVK